MLTTVSFQSFLQLVVHSIVSAILVALIKKKSISNENRLKTRDYVYFLFNSLQNLFRCAHWTN